MALMMACLFKQFLDIQAVDDSSFDEYYLDSFERLIC